MLCVRCPTIAIAADRGTPARSRFRTAVRLKSWGILPAMAMSWAILPYVFARAAEGLSQRQDTQLPEDAIGQAPRR
jgi:hypothetical protein